MRSFLYLTTESTQAPIQPLVEKHLIRIKIDSYGLEIGVDAEKLQCFDRTLKLRECFDGVLTLSLRSFPNTSTRLFRLDGSHQGLLLRCLHLPYNEGRLQQHNDQQQQQTLERYTERRNGTIHREFISYSSFGFWNFTLYKKSEKTMKNYSVSIGL